MINVVDKQVNTSNLTKLNNNINKDYEMTNRNISDFS